MPIYKPSDLHHFLEGLGIKPRKRLSQNFLIDGNILKKIVVKSQITPKDVVLEIGPGPGSLTESLLAAGATVIAVEKDPTLAHALERLKESYPRLEVFCEDILTFPLEEKLAPYLAENQKIKLISNLPYHLTTPIISKFVVMDSIFSMLIVMVQEEVARRFIALPKTSEYSSFTLFLNFFSVVQYAFSVSRHCFYPEPNVDSAIVILAPKTPPHVSNQTAFFKMTRTSFQQRRKMLRSSLRTLFSPSDVEQALVSLGLNAQARPEELSLDQFIALYEKLSLGT